MFRQDDKVYVCKYKDQSGNEVAFNKSCRFIRAHANGITCAIDVGKHAPPNGVAIANLSNVTLQSPAEAKIAYLHTPDGSKFVELLRPFQSSMYAKVRYPEKFFSRYLKSTGVLLSEGDHGILISRQDDKYGDEISMRFALENFEPIFPNNAHPRLYNTGRGILNDNDYIWALIEDHGFRFAKDV